MAGKNVVGYKGTETERFWKRVKIIENGCWEWTGGTNGEGYGSFALALKPGERRCKGIKAHQWAYINTIGPIPKGTEPDHLCRNKICVNPLHLEPVTHRENVLRGSGPTAENARKTQCIRGHQFTPENTILKSDGTRNCRICHNEKTKIAQRIKRAKIKAEKQASLYAMLDDNKSRD